VSNSIILTEYKFEVNCFMDAGSVPPLEPESDSNDKIHLEFSILYICFFTIFHGLKPILD